MARKIQTPKPVEAQAAEDQAEFTKAMEAADLAQKEAQEMDAEVKARVLSYFKQHPDTLQAVLALYDGKTMVEGVEIPNATLIAMAQEDSELGPKLEAMAADMLKAAGLPTAEDLAEEVKGNAVSFGIA